MSGTGGVAGRSFARAMMCSKVMSVCVHTSTTHTSCGMLPWLLATAAVPLVGVRRRTWTTMGSRLMASTTASSWSTLEKSRAFTYGDKTKNHSDSVSWWKDATHILLQHLNTLVSGSNCDAYCGRKWRLVIWTCREIAVPFNPHLSRDNLADMHALFIHSPFNIHIWKPRSTFARLSTVRRRTASGAATTS